MSNSGSSEIIIKEANQNDYFLLELCAKEFIELIKNFKKKFENNDFFVLIGYFKEDVAGVLVSERNNIVRTIENIVPTTQIHFLYVNPAFRGKKIGTTLLNEFIKIQKKNNIALIFIELYKNNKKEIEFFETFGFRREKIDAAKIYLNLRLWDDLGISSDDFFETFT